MLTLSEPYGLQVYSSGLGPILTLWYLLSCKISYVNGVKSIDFLKTTYGFLTWLKKAFNTTSKKIQSLECPFKNYVVQLFPVLALNLFLDMHEAGGSVGQRHSLKRPFFPHCPSVSSALPRALCTGGSSRFRLFPEQIQVLPAAKGCCLVGRVAPACPSASNSGAWPSTFTLGFEFQEKLSLLRF